MNNTGDNAPDQDQVDHWKSAYSAGIERRYQLMEQGFHIEKGIPFQDVFDGFAMDYSGLGRSCFLNSDLIETVRTIFGQAAQSTLRAFTVVYDSSDPLYNADNTRFSSVSERQFIEGIFYALMAADFELAAELSRWFRNTPDDDPMDPEVNDFAFALKHTLLGETEKAITLLRPRLDKYLKKIPKGGYKRNYFTLTTALVGILEKDVALFNEGLTLKLHFHLGDARGEYRNMPQGFICDDAVALANLGLHHGLPVTVSDYRMPLGLLTGKKS